MKEVRNDIIDAYKKARNEYDSLRELLELDDEHG